MNETPPNNREIHTLYSLMTQHIVSKVLEIGCSIRLDQILSEKGRITIEELAALCHFHPSAMFRFLRVLDAYNVVELLEGNQVQKGPLCHFLDHIRDPHLINGQYAIQNLRNCLETNSECYSATFGKTFHSHILESSSMIHDFNIWSAKSAREWLIPAITSQYNLFQFKTICDVGGDGYLLALLLEKNITQKGILFAEEDTLNSAKKIFVDHRVNPRIKTYLGSPFENFPKGADIYILCRVLLNHNDEAILNIINNAHLSLQINTRLLIVDFLLPDKDHPDYKISTIADLNILTCLNGSLRTKKEWLSLLQQSNFGNLNFYETSNIPVLPMFIAELKN